MRLFVALVPPPEVLDHVQRAVTLARADGPELRWTRPEQWHLTLAFLGEVDDETRTRLERRLGRAADRHRALSMWFAGAGRFGHRVLWTGVHGDREGLSRLVDSVRAAVRRSGLAAEQRPYRPHVTLARARGAADLRPMVERLHGLESPTWTATALYLVRSRLGAGPGGSAAHETAAWWPLADASAAPGPEQD